MLRYARALANAQRADVAQIPVVTEGGSNAYAHLLIGPASQLFSTPIENSESGPVDPEVILTLERLTRELQPDAPDWPQEMTDVETLSFLEFGI
ncbi:MAG: hypothetical protein M3N46_03655 [Actinomycetota bacterium]|nr:hypothetical protein [Actinomycetota bacterium]